jgi:hypothetical protein
MKRNQNASKLRIRSETIRQLGDKELKQAQGGESTNPCTAGGVIVPQTPPKL